MLKRILDLKVREGKRKEKAGGRGGEEENEE